MIKNILDGSGMDNTLLRAAMLMGLVLLTLWIITGLIIKEVERRAATK